MGMVSSTMPLPGTEFHLPLDRSLFKKGCFKIDILDRFNSLYCLSNGIAACTGLVGKKDADAYEQYRGNSRNP
jgi:hypothetical protein